MFHPVQKIRAVYGEVLSVWRQLTVAIEAHTRQIGDMYRTLAAIESALAALAALDGRLSAIEQATRYVSDAARYDRQAGT